ncbi:MAG: SUMF1/EgtB/PvdO family nonheme iron enzyme, partial [Phycisphaerae bacterium]
FLNILEPYLVKTNEAGLPILTAVDESRYPMSLFVSTGIRISRCSFQRCMHVLSVWADWALMEHCSIETHPDMRGPAILSGAALMLEEVTGLAHVTPGRQQWWITVHPQKQPSGIVSLDLKNVKLKTDSEGGLCVVHNESKFTGGCHVYIIADGCEFQSAGSEENSVIYLVEAPNIISVRNCRETSGRKVDLLGFKEPFDEDYFHRHSPEVFSFLVDDNNRNLIANLPKTMRAFVDKPLPEKVAQRFEVKPTTVTLSHMRKGITTQLNVMDFGAGGKGTTDDSAAFQKAFTAAGEKSGLVEVIVPAGLYRMGRPVELPPRVVVRGVGLAALTVLSERKEAIFTVPAAEHIAVQNLHFFNCEQAMEITTKRKSKSNILVDYCNFYQISRQAITCLSGTGAIAELNETTLRMSDCNFSLCNSALLHNARHALMDNPWISTSPNAVDSGVIVNKGFFHLKALLGVPRDTDQRWVDNYGEVCIDRCRFGGESGGLPMVRNFTAGGEVLIQNSWLMIYASFTGKRKPITVVDCAEIPALIALRGNWGWPFPAMMVTVRPGAKGKLAGRFFESCNTAPAAIKDERIKEIVHKPFYYPLPASRAKFPVSTKASAGETGGLPREISIDLGAGIFMDMILVLPGTFTMGSPLDEKGHRENENQHTVRITKPFYLGKHEVTQAVWERVMTAKMPNADSKSDPLKRYWSGSYNFDGSYALDITDNSRPSSFVAPQRPVENVSWRQSKEFLARLNLLVDGGGFRLPTEAEWEYASRAGTSTAYFFENDAAAGLDTYAWYKSNGGEKTSRVGTRQPNLWGFYDMYGNVWEWCEDQFTGEPYSIQDGPALLDPCLRGDAGGNQYQVVRGGSFAFSARTCRSANRSGFDAWHFNHDIGLRLVKTIPAAGK